MLYFLIANGIISLNILVNHQLFSCFLDFDLSSETTTLQTLNVFKHTRYRL